MLATLSPNRLIFSTFIKLGEIEKTRSSMKMLRLTSERPSDHHARQLAPALPWSMPPSRVKPPSSVTR